MILECRNTNPCAATFWHIQLRCYHVEYVIQIQIQTLDVIQELVVIINSYTSLTQKQSYTKYSQIDESGLP